MQPQFAVHRHDSNAEEFIGGGTLTIGTCWVLVEADPVVTAGMASVLAVHVAGVHVVVARRAGSNTNLHEARLVVLALGARDDPPVPLAPDVAQGRQLVVVGVLFPHRDQDVVAFAAALVHSALSTGGVLEALLVVAALLNLRPDQSIPRNTDRKASHASTSGKSDESGKRKYPFTSFSLGVGPSKPQSQSQ